MERAYGGGGANGVISKRRPIGYRGHSKSAESIYSHVKGTVILSRSELNDKERGALEKYQKKLMQ